MSRGCAEFQAHPHCRLAFVACYWQTLNLANLTNSCFTPAFSNCTVAFMFSPEPSSLVTLPMPKRSCSIMQFSFKPSMGVSLPPAFARRDAIMRLRRGEKVSLTGGSSQCAASLRFGSALNCEATGWLFWMSVE